MPDFSDTRDLLNRRPHIQFVEPEQITGDQGTLTEEPVQTIESQVTQLQEVIEQYKRLEELSDLAQERLDSRVGNTEMCLDPDIDFNVIVSLKRKFGDVPPCITYEQYKHCLQELTKLGQENALRLTEEDLVAAAGRTSPTSFGGYTRTIGGMRPELQFKSPVKPLNAAAFQRDSTKKLFKMLLPMLTQLVDAKILTHLLTAKHS